MRVGSELKAARKKSGITVEVISKRTKIQVSKLVALEKNDFKNLPTGLYLFAAVRAYAGEVHIDPEPIVERLRAEFADKDALDALHALDATGALTAKTLADPGRSKDGPPNFLRNAAIAAGVVLMAAAGAGVYLHNRSRTVNSPSETLSIALASPAPASTVPVAIDVPQQTPVATQRPAQTKTLRPRTRSVAAIEVPSPALIEEPADTPSHIEGLKPETTVPATAP